MNKTLTEPDFDQYLRFLGRAVVLARFACQGGDTQHAEALLDMIHNLPRFLVGEEHLRFEAEYRALYVAPVVEKFPDLRGLEALLAGRSGYLSQ